MNMKSLNTNRFEFEGLNTSDLNMNNLSMRNFIHSKRRSYRCKLCRIFIILGLDVFYKYEYIYNYIRQFISIEIIFKLDQSMTIK